MQDLWQAQLLIILLKEFTKLYVNTDTMTEVVKLKDLNTKIATAFLNTQTLKIIDYKYVYCNKNFEKKFHENLKLVSALF